MDWKHSKWIAKTKCCHLKWTIKNVVLFAISFQFWKYEEGGTKDCLLCYFFSVLVAVKCNFLLRKHAFSCIIICVKKEWWFVLFTNAAFYESLKIQCYFELCCLVVLNTLFSWGLKPCNHLREEKGIYNSQNDSQKSF